MELHDKNKEKKKQMPGKVVEIGFLICTLPNLQLTSVVSVDPPPLPHSSLPNYKALKFYSPESKR